MEAIAKENVKVSATEENELHNCIFSVAPGVWRMKDIFVNVYIIENPESRSWVLVDTGLKSSAPKIKQMAREVTDSKSKPVAIILTHGHFDHRGSLKELAKEWKVPVYAHELELPYLTGKASYPPADPSVNGGIMASMAFAYPRKPINVEGYLQELQMDGTVDYLPDWEWIHTPGHTPGHISLFRSSDRLLIAGDAFVTTQQESLYSVALQREKVCGPPRYFTPDWVSAGRSVSKLAALKPNIIATGHGHAMYGDKARIGLETLNRDFHNLAIPKEGRYVNEPARFDEEGPVFIPKDYTGYWPKMAGLAAGLIAGLYLYRTIKRTFK